MKNLLDKISQNKKVVTIITFLIVIVVITVAIFLRSNNPSNVVKRYCDILVKGNYANIIDIAYFPDSEFITKEKIEEVKKLYFERVNNNNKDITKCEYSIANETEEKINYKLIINGSETLNIEVDKKTNKLLIDGLYTTRTIETQIPSKLTVDGKEVKNFKKTENSDSQKYKLVLLSNIDYKIKVTPKVGITDEQLNEEIEKKSTDGAKIELSDRKTDLENGTDTLTFSSQYQDEILNKSGTFQIVYKFDETQYLWKYSSIENEKYESSWNISGTWSYSNNSNEKSVIFKITEKDGEVTGTLTDIRTGLLGYNTLYTFTSGTFDDGNLEMHGTFTNINKPQLKCNTVLTGAIYSKQKEIKFSRSTTGDSICWDAKSEQITAIKK